MSTLVFHHGALGDSVLIWPLLRALDRATLVAPMGKAKLAARWVAGIAALDGETTDHTRMFVPQAKAECSDAWRARLAGASTIISFVSTGNDAWAVNARAMAPNAAMAFVRPRPSDDDAPTHLMDFHLQQMHNAGLDIEPVDPPRRHNRDGLVVIHPGSGGAAKRWPLERFIAVIDHLVAIGRPPTVVIGEVERDTWPADDVRLIGSLAEIACPDDLIELSRLLARASVYLGNDSGPTHLAAQLGVPTIALFGPSDPRIWSPIGPIVRLIAPPKLMDMTWLSPEPVIEALSRFG